MNRLATLLLMVQLLLVPAVMSGTGAVALAAAKDKSGETAAIPPDASPEQVQAIMAGMSDAQVRRMLLDELKKSAEAKPVKPKETGFSGVVRDVRQWTGHVHERFSYVFSGAALAPRALPKALKGIMAGSGHMKPWKLAVSLAALTLLWLLGMRIFKKRSAKTRKAISATPENAPWYIRMSRLFMRALLDICGVVVVGFFILLTYLLFFSDATASKPLVIAWFLAIFFLEMVKVVSRFLLAPHAPSLRYLPLTDDTARYLFRWVLRVARVIAVGLFANKLIRFEGGSEAASLITSSLFGFIVTFMVSLLALWNKKPVADHMRRTNKEGTLLYQLADLWHVGAIAYVFGFWIFWEVALVVYGNEAMLPGFITLLIIPLYLLADWATQRLVAFAVDLAESNAPEPQKDDSGEETEDSPAITRFQNFLSKGFKVLVFAAAVFLLLRVWGINIAIGREVVRAAINTLVTLVLAYIFWVFVSGLIERKLKASGSGEAESGEGGGGPGGDRFSTLLQLVKKFIFVAIAVITVLIILSSIGVDVGPLIAGASVFGIAIGFGAQTLVKDIISGIFFLMDDAFRVGDYIIVGSARGTVEEISVRSFKLRHHLGPLYTVPFGSIKEIQNMSRDWAIMKLQYLVPFDTDLAKVKKIIKEINKEIKAVPELKEVMLDDIKSQGVKAMEEFGMRMRVKFKTKPGGQFTLRKLVLAKMRKKFEEAGIDFAKPRVTVHMPGDKDLTDEEQRVAAAAAAQKAVQEDKQPKK